MSIIPLSLSVRMQTAHHIIISAQHNNTYCTKRFNPLLNFHVHIHSDDGLAGKSFMSHTRYSIYGGPNAWFSCYIVAVILDRFTVHKNKLIQIYFYAIHVHNNNKSDDKAHQMYIM